jgi:Common central domain of tyrosinase
VHLLVTIAAPWIVACSDAPASPDGLPDTSTPVDAPSTGPATGKAPGGAPPDVAKSPLAVAPRADLNTLSGTQLGVIFTAIDRYIRTATISVKVLGTDVVPWENAAFDRIAPVSVERAHHAIHHAGEHFFTCHRWYVELMESVIGADLPQGRLPAWKPSNPIPAQFSVVGPPMAGGDCETLGSLATVNAKGVLCEFAFTNTYVNLRGVSVSIKGLENLDPRVPFPSKYLPKNICQFKSAGELADDIGAGFQRTPGYHNLVHNAIGGTMRSMDATAAAIFWPWHATVDDIFQSWLDCNLEVPAPCPVQ